MTHQTITVTGFLHARECPVNHEISFYMLPYISNEVGVWGVPLGEVTFTHTLPEGFDIKSETVRARINELNANRREAEREFRKTVRSIDEEISKLTAITYTPEAA